MNSISRLFFAHLLIGLALCLATRFVFTLSEPLAEYIDLDTAVFAIMSGVMLRAITSAFALGEKEAQKQSEG